MSQLQCPTCSTIMTIQAGLGPGSIVQCPGCSTQVQTPAMIQQPQQQHVIVNNSNRFGIPGLNQTTTYTTTAGGVPGVVGANPNTVIYQNGAVRSQEEQNAMIFFLVGFCCAISWMVGFCMYFKSTDPGTKTWTMLNGIFSLFFVLFSVFLIVLFSTSGYW